MHGTAIENAKWFLENYVSREMSGHIVEIGAHDINGSMRPLVPVKMLYTGLDLEAGQGVDIVMNDPYHIPLSDQSANIVVSTSTFEHVEFFWETFLEMARICVTGGLIYLNSPSAGPYHPCPVDCWRFYPGAGLALQKWSILKGVPTVLIRSHICEYTFTDEKGEVICGDQWKDWVAVFKRL
jgi:methyltransferase family protein